MTINPVTPGKVLATSCIRDEFGAPVGHAFVEVDPDTLSPKEFALADALTTAVNAHGFTSSKLEPVLAALAATTS